MTPEQYAAAESEIEVASRRRDRSPGRVFLTEKGEAEIAGGEGELRFEVLPGVGHASLSRAPHRYRDILRDFLAEAEASAH